MKSVSYYSSVISDWASTLANIVVFIFFLVLFVMVFWFPETIGMIWGRIINGFNAVTNGL